MARILIHEPRPSSEGCQAFLAGHGHDVVVCKDRDSLFDALAEARPDVVVYVLNEFVVDLGVLSLLRRMAPTLPIIVLGGTECLAARRSVQELKPTYYGVFPLEPSELGDAVKGALGHRGRAAAS